MAGSGTTTRAAPPKGDGILREPAVDEATNAGTTKGHDHTSPASPSPDIGAGARPAASDSRPPRSRRPSAKVREAREDKESSSSALDPSAAAKGTKDPVPTKGKGKTSTRKRSPSPGADNSGKDSGPPANQGRRSHPDPFEPDDSKYEAWLAEREREEREASSLKASVAAKKKVAASHKPPTVQKTPAPAPPADPGGFRSVAQWTAQQKQGVREDDKEITVTWVTPGGDITQAGKKEARSVRRTGRARHSRLRR